MKKYLLKNATGLEISVIDYGLTFIDIKLKGKSLLVKYDDYQSYKNNDIFLNAFVGPAAGRIEKGIFKIKNKVIQLETNNGDNYIHGGNKPWSNQFFNIKTWDDKNNHYLSGTLNIENKSFLCKYNIIVKLSIPKFKNELSINYKINSNKPSLCNPTHHFYWNLSNQKSALDQNLKINLKNIWLLNKSFNPYKKVKGIKVKTINDLANFNQEQRILVNNGIDHPMLLKNNKIILYDDKTQIQMTSSMKTVVVYSHNWPSINLIKNQTQNKYLGICFEFQKIPISFINNDYESVTIGPKKEYNETINYKFKLISN